MTGEVWVFWAVAAGFLLADNLVLVPLGADVLRVGRDGALRYDPSARREARGRELVWKNPLDLFARLAVTTSAVGRLDAARYARTRRELRLQARALRPIGWIGAVYGLALVALAAWSARAPFGWVALALLAAHLLAWSTASTLLLARRKALPLSGWQAASLVVEAFFVPAYTVNLAPRALRKQPLDVPSLPLALHRAARIGDEGERALYVHRLEQRLALHGDALSEATLHLQRPFLEEAKRCLATSASRS